MYKKIIILILFIPLFLTSNAQKALTFKHYDKEIVFDESYLDQSFASFFANNKVLSKENQLTNAEYANFKTKIIEGRWYGRYLQVDNLRRFYLNPFGDDYYYQLKTDQYKLKLQIAKKENRKDVFIKSMKIRNEILSWIVDLIIANSK